jgi:hypothetical protein
MVNNTNIYSWGEKNKELLLNGWPRVTAEAPSFFPIIFVFIREKITNQVERKRGIEGE